MNLLMKTGNENINAAAAYGENGKPYYCRHMISAYAHPEYAGEYRNLQAPYGDEF